MKLFPEGSGTCSVIGLGAGIATGLSAGLSAGYVLGSKSADYFCQFGGRFCCTLTGGSMMLEGGLLTYLGAAKAISERQVSVNDFHYLVCGVTLGFAGMITTILLPSMLSIESVVASDDIANQPLDAGLLQIDS